MRAAIVGPHFAGGICIGEMPKPTPSATQLRVRVQALSVNPIDWRLLLPTGYRVPLRLVPCADFSGVVDAVGRAVRGFAPGDRVFGCKVFSLRGSAAEFLTISPKAVAIAPASLDLADAAALPMAALSALQGLRLGGLAAGQRVLIIGAAGGVGHCAVQIAKARGAEVIAVCSQRNTDFVKALGADQVIAYDRKDFRRELTGVDCVFDAVGADDLHRLDAVLVPDGRYVTTLPNLRSGAQLATSALKKIAGRTRGGRTAHLLNVTPNSADLREIAAMVERGDLAARMEKYFSLDALAAAWRLSQSGHVRGKLVVRVADQALDGAP